MDRGTGTESRSLPCFELDARLAQQSLQGAFRLSSGHAGACKSTRLGNRNAQGQCSRGGRALPPSLFPHARTATKHRVTI